MMGNPPGGYPPPPGGGPPGGYPPPVPPPGYQQGGYPPQGMPPGAYPPGAPPAKRGKPWWVWLLGGCGCFMLVCLLAFAGTAWWAWSQWTTAMNEVGPLDEATVKRNLGEVPVYPGAKLDETTSKAILAICRIVEKWIGEKPGSMVQAGGFFSTSDASGKIIAWYDKQMAKAGWKMGTPDARDKPKNQEQRLYQKGSDLAVVIVSDSGADRLAVFRGGPRLMEILEKAESAPKPSK